MREHDSMTISQESASRIVPDSFYNFTSHLLSDKVKQVDNRVELDKQKESKTLMLSHPV